MRYLTALVVSLALLALPTVGAAEMSDELRKELDKHATTHLEEGDGPAKRPALLTLGMLADGDEDIKKIKNFKTKDDEMTRLYAGMALLYADAEEAETFLLEQLGQHSQIYPILRDHVSLMTDDAERDVLKKFLDGLEAAKRKGVFRYLARRRGALYDLLKPYVTSDDDAVRGQALNAVRSTAHPKAFAWAETLVDADDEALQTDGFELMMALSKIPGKQERAKESLKTALEAGTTSIQIRAAERLFELHDRSAGSKLASLLEAADETERQKKLVRLMLEYDVTPSIDTITSLRDKTDDETLDQLLMNLAVSAGHDGTLEKVREMYGTTKFDQRLKAAHALGYADGDDVVQTLGRALLSEGNAKMRLQAAEGLRRIGSEEALEPLKRALDQEKQSKVKVEIIRALGSIGTEEAMQVLQFNSTVKKPELKKAILRAVRDAQHETGFEVLKLFFSDRNLDIQWKAFVAALDLDPDKGMERAKRAFRNPPDGFVSDLAELDLSAQKKVYSELLTHDNRRVRDTAFRRARRIGEPMLDRLRDVLIDGDAPTAVRRDVIDLFASRQSAGNAPYLEKIVRDADDEELARRAARALVQYESESMEASFRGYLEHDDKVVQALAVYGIGAIHRESEED